MHVVHKRGTVLQMSISILKLNSILTWAETKILWQNRKLAELKAAPVNKCTLATATTAQGRSASTHLFPWVSNTGSAFTAAALWGIMQ